MGKSIAHLLKLLKIFNINILVSVKYPKQNIVLIKHPSFPAFHLRLLFHCQQFPLLVLFSFWEKQNFL